MPVCKDCYRYNGFPRPRCPEGKKVYEEVVQARKEFEEGGGSYREWCDRWDEWVRHYKGKKEKTKSKVKQTEF